MSQTASIPVEYKGFLFENLILVNKEDQWLGQWRWAMKIHKDLVGTTSDPELLLKDPRINQTKIRLFWRKDREIRTMFLHRVVGIIVLEELTGPMDQNDFFEQYYRSYTDRSFLHNKWNDFRRHSIIPAGVTIDTKLQKSHYPHLTDAELMLYSDNPAVAMAINQSRSSKPQE